MKWLLCILSAALCSSAFALDTPSEQRLRAAQAQLREGWLAEDPAALEALYVDDAMLMPEHSVARRGREAIADYYRRWFAAVDVASYRRTPREVLPFGDSAIEIGHYQQGFGRDGAAPYSYDGKYMTLWDLRGEQPRIVSELWGADAPFERAALPEIAAATSPIANTFTNDAAVLAEVTQRNALIGKLVTERRGGEHAELFFPDAIYLTYYTPMLVGMDEIRPYFVEHEKPGTVAIDALALRSGHLHVLAPDTVLEEGFYRVGWRAGTDAGVVEGKSLNLWKRDGDGEFKLYRQAVNHD